MPAERRDFSATLEPLIYWDTSFALANLFEAELHHRECRAFGDRFGEERCLALISDFVFDEIAFWMLKKTLIAEARKVGVPWQRLRRHRSNLTITVIGDFTSRRVQIESQALKLSIPDTVTDRAIQLMRAFALLPTDAYHIATALESGVSAFVTLDEDFLIVDGIVVYTCLPQASPHQSQ